MPKMTPAVAHLQWYTSNRLKRTRLTRACAYLCAYITDIARHGIAPRRAAPPRAAPRRAASLHPLIHSSTHPLIHISRKESLRFDLFRFRTFRKSIGSVRFGRFGFGSVPYSFLQIFEHRKHPKCAYTYMHTRGCMGAWTRGHIDACIRTHLRP